MSWGDKYHGGWKDGVMHGQGKYYLPTEINTWVRLNGLRNGQGLYVKTNGSELIGLWENNQFGRRN